MQEVCGEKWFVIMKGKGVYCVGGKMGCKCVVEIGKWGLLMKSEQ